MLVAQHASAQLSAVDTALMHREGASVSDAERCTAIPVRDHKLNVSVRLTLLPLEDTQSTGSKLWLRNFKRPYARNFSAVQAQKVHNIISTFLLSEFRSIMALRLGRLRVPSLHLAPPLCSLLGSHARRHGPH